MKKLMVLLFSAFLLIGISACSVQDSSAGQSYVLVEINPSIEFILDEEDVVTSYALLNEDAEAVMAESDVEFVGLSIENAIDTWLDLAIEHGYLDATREDNVVYLTVVNDDEDLEEEKGEAIREHAEGYMLGRSIGGAVVNSGLTMEEFIAEARELGISPGKLRMVYAASADGEITIEEALELSHRELMNIIKEAHGMPNHRQHRDENMPNNARRNQ